MARRAPAIALALCAIAALLALAFHLGQAPAPRAEDDAHDASVARARAADDGALGGSSASGAGDARSQDGRSGGAPRLAATSAAGRVSGSVRGPDGDPVASAELRARDEDAPPGQPVRALARTGASGAFAFVDLEDGIYAIEARAQGLRPETIRGIEVAAGAPVEDVDFVLDAGERITGTVVDGATGAPIPGASVHAHALEALSGRTLTRAREVREADRPAEGSTSTEADGAFEIAGLAGGVKLVSAKAKGYRTSEVVEVALGEGGAAPAPIRLALLSGDYIAGRVTGPDGGALASVRVRAEPEGMGPFAGGGSADEGGEASTEADGTYRIDGVHGRRFRVTAWPTDPAFAPASQNRVAPNRDDVDLTLAAGASLAGIVLAEETGEPLAGAEVDIGIAGTRKSVTTGADGAFAFAGLPAMRLQLRAQQGRRAPHEDWVTLEASGAREGMVITLGAGAVLNGQVVSAVDGMPLAGAQVYATAIEAPGGREGGREGGRGGRGGRGGPGGGFGGAQQALLVVEALATGGDRTGAMPDAMFSEVEARAVATDDQGRFRLDGLRAGAVAVAAAHATHPGALERCDLEPGGETSVTIRLPPGGRIEGSVRDAETQPVRGAVIVAFSFAGRARSAESEASGVYAIEGLYPGSYLVNLRGAPGAGAAAGSGAAGAEGAAGFRAQTVTIERGRTTRVDFGAEVQALVRGLVRRALEPVAERDVTLLATGGQTGFSSATTDAEGRFEARLPAGSYLARVGNVSQPFAIAAGATEAEVVIDLPEGAVAGATYDAITGEPLRAQVSVYRGARSAQADSLSAAFEALAGDARASEAGLFQVRGLGPGPHTVVARLDGYADAHAEVSVPEGSERGGVDLRLEPGGVLSGIVQGPDGTPAPATIWVVDAARVDLPTGNPPRTDEEGVFSIQRFAPGRYQVTVLTDSFAPWRRVIDFAGGEQELVVALSEGASVEVRVTHGGQPVAGALVDLRYPDGQRVITSFADFIQEATPTDALGVARKPRLPAGSLVGRVRPPPGGPFAVTGEATFTVAVQDGAEAVVEVALP